MTTATHCIAQRIKSLVLIMTTAMLTWPLTTLGADIIAKLPDTDLTWKNIFANGQPATVFSLYLDSRGLMWAGTNNGLCFYDGITTHAVKKEGLSGVQIYSIVEKDDCLYLGTNNGLQKFNYSTGKIETAGNSTLKEIRCLLMVDDVLWIGSLYGVFTMDIHNEKVTDVSAGLPHISTYSILRDSRGILYVGTYNGLARWDSARKAFAKLPVQDNRSDLQNLFVNCLLESEDGKRIYVGTEGSLYCYTVNTGNWNKITAVEGNNIKSLARIYDKHIFVGTDNGAFDISAGTTKHYRHDSRQPNTLADNEIWCIFTDKDNNVWTGHEKGFSIASSSSTIRPIRLSTLIDSGEGNEIHSILRDRTGELWLGGTNGIIRITGKNGSHWYRHSDNAHSLSHNRIRAIDEDKAGTIWLSTDGGLNRFNRESGKFEAFYIVDKSHKHNTNWVYAMVEDDKSYWIGGFLGGLHRVGKEKFGTAGGTIISDFTLNAETKQKSPKGLWLENNLVNDIVRDNNGNIWILLFRDDILACYNPEKGTITRHNIHEITGNYPSNIALDYKQRLWCTFDGGVVLFNTDGSHKVVSYTEGDKSESVLAMSAVGTDMWLSTVNNVWRIDGKTLKPTILPIPQKRYTAIYNDVKTGKVLLGGADEILEVNPSNLTNISYRKGIRLAVFDNDKQEFDLYDVQNDTEGLTIPYRGGVSLVVASLDYSPQTVNRYMYKLAASKTDSIDGWVILPEGVNTITLSDLTMGDYEILVKKVGFPMSPVSFHLRVKAPLALSWWAIIIYIMVMASVVYAIIYYLQRRNKRRFQEEERRKSLENVERKLTFLSDISHDLKTPLSMIIGPVSLMKEQTDDPETKRSLETVYDNAVRLNNMIHRTIELHHLEDEDDNMLIFSTFDVIEFCRSVFETFKENHPQNRFVFHSSCPKLLIEGDAVKFESVMTNLLSNACKYSEEGATISCGISKQENFVEIVVSDDGIGISEIDQPLVFQRMFRAPSTAKLHEGTGLGLYLIKKYLELMNGNISMYSKEGQGTSFIVSLPLSDKEMPTETSPITDKSDDRPKILIVEDNSQLSAFIADFLRVDYIVLCAQNGRAGLSIASSFQPDLIIADEMMPIMTGLEMCKRMKQNPRLVYIPVIMLTAKSDNMTENESIKLGIDIFMPKPFDPTVLMSRIKHLIKSRNDITENVRIQAITAPKPIEAISTTEKQLSKIAKIIEDNVSDPDLNVNLLCEKSGIPNKQLYRIIKKFIGVSPVDYIRRVRLQKAAMLISQHRFTVSEICYMVGFKTPSYFAKCFQAEYGVKPSHYMSDDDTSSKKSDITTYKNDHPE